MRAIAFYAPMKPPTHSVPSGDREMARGVIKALSDPARAVSVDLASEFRCYDGKGDASFQRQLFAQAEIEAARLVAQGGWAAWVTYHSYYKAPDLLGPAVSKALGIPYVQIEATRAAKRFGGAWDLFAHAADASCDVADAIFYLTQQDGEGLWPYEKPHQVLKQLHPFLHSEHLPDCQSSNAPVILTTAMMRHGDKLASYQIIAQALRMLGDTDWQFEIAGDGPARSEIEAMFAPFGDRVRFLGQLDRNALQDAYAKAAVFLWPGVNEAFGMVYLEAQAAGVPVVAQDRPGVRDVLPWGACIPQDDIAALAVEIGKLLGEPAYHSMRSAQARALIADKHLLGAARDTIWSVLGPLTGETS